LSSRPRAKHESRDPGPKGPCSPGAPGSRIFR
jgi:hypothetical protein